MFNISNPDIIEQLVAWGLRLPYWRQIFRDTEPQEHRRLVNHVRACWRDIHGRSSPSGQMPISSSKHLMIRTRAMHLASVYNTVLYYASGTTSAQHPPAKSDYLSLHDGYRTYLETITEQPSVDINLVYQMVLDAHLFRVYAQSPEKSLPPPVLLRVCANPSCPAYDVCQDR